jgi:twitching motility protein PilT
LYKQGLISEETAKAYASNKGIVSMGNNFVKSSRGKKIKDLLGKLQVDTDYGKLKKPW